MIVGNDATVVREVVNRGGQCLLRVDDPWDGGVSERPLDHMTHDVCWTCPCRSAGPRAVRR